MFCRCNRLLLKVLPTLADKNTYVPMKAFNAIFIVGRFFNKIVTSDGDDSQIRILLRKHGPKFFVNLMIVIAILAIIDYFNDDIVSLISETGIPLAIEPEILLTIISILLIIYPVITLLGKIEKLVTNISDVLSTKLIPANTRKLEEKPLHRLLRNIFFVGFLLIIIAIMQPYIADIVELPFLSFVISVIGLGVAVLLIADSVFVFQKLSHGHIMDGLMKEDEPIDDKE